MIRTACSQPSGKVLMLWLLLAIQVGSDLIHIFFLGGGETFLTTTYLVVHNIKYENLYCLFSTKWKSAHVVAPTGHPGEDLSFSYLTCITRKPYIHDISRELLWPAESVSPAGWQFLNFVSVGFKDSVGQAGLADSAGLADHADSAGAFRC